MNKYIFSTVWCFIAIIASFTFSSCSDDDSENPDGGAITGRVCTKWGSSKSEVMDYMKDYEVNSMENGFICYDGKNDISTISYHLVDNALQASLVLIPEDNTSLEELESSFSGYEYLGEKSNLHIYINEAANTMVTIGKKVNDNQTYYAIGYAMLAEDSEL